MIWLWQNPPAVWQWVGIAVTCVGTGLSLAAVLFARSAKVAAERAAERAAGFNVLVRLEEVRRDLAKLDQAVADKDCPEVVLISNRLHVAIGRLPVRPGPDVWGAEGREQTTRILRTITRTAGSAGGRPRNAQIAQLHGAVGELCETIGEALGRIETLLRNEHG